MPKILYLLRIFLYCTFLLHISPLLATIQPRCIYEMPTGETGICITAPVTINSTNNPCVAKAKDTEIPQMDIITYCDTKCTKVVKCEYQCAGTMLGSTGYAQEYYGNGHQTNDTGIISANFHHGTTCYACPADKNCSSAYTQTEIWDYGYLIDSTGIEYYAMEKSGGTCKAGYYDDETKGCTICPTGNYCPIGSKKPTACPAGKYNNETGQSTCQLCPAGSYSAEGATSCTACPAGKYNNQTGQSECQLCTAGSYSDEGATSCKTCPAGYYCTGGVNKKTCPGYSETSNVICNSQNPCINSTLIPDLIALKAIYKNRQIENAYPSEITAITGVAIPSYLTAAEKITQCGATYTVTNQRGTFVQERIMYNETTRRYDNPDNETIYYTKILPGYYAKTRLYTQDQCTSTSNRQKLYTNAVLCPAGQYCTGFKDGMPTCDGNYPDVLGISGNIAAGYFSNGGATSAQPNYTTPINGGTGCIQSTDCPDDGCYCGYVARGHYSTGGGTLFSPSGPGDGCLDDFDCGVIAAGYYSTGGAPSKIPANCVSGGECGKLAGGHFATCGAKKKNPTVPQSGTNPDCATGCECGYTDEGYYSSGGGTKYNPNGVGDGCLTGFQCGPCNRENNEICPRGSSSKQACEAGKYCQISGTQLIKNNCPVGTTSNAGATAITNCFINSNTNFCVKDTANQAINRCFNLPNGTKINLK